MAINAPFSPHGLTVGLATSGTASTANSRQITSTILGIKDSVFAALQSVMCVNRGTADVWISFTTATATIAIPVADGTDTGTPAQALVLIPGAYLIFTLNTGPTLWVNDISTGTSQDYYLTFGEGN